MSADIWPVNPAIKLKASGGCVYGEIGTPCMWVHDQYTWPLEGFLTCCECGYEITDETLWTCLDGGDAAHNGCVEVVR